ncbi:MAG: 50S ribosomal protein L10 [Mobiluncus porci]|uniref:50S ribosomal protein L10 n=1 Tax=Mobiluncus TaxID=2050 RepID=UPI0023F5381D|nr:MULTISPECIES: 50S ribosomal protein L10 [Mobiluncus]MCI6584131.1 50S ribosomal protein L10 [Mobiluncus sp.]MDD7541922.1 50S ribosomal protein L10 [Mobiluncus porci]MDY5748855.1 50S ribosomal protein L10 [Mobiluncus porci]
MAKPEKVTEVKSLADSAKDAAAVILTEYRGLTVKQMKELRTNLGTDVRYAVAKNKLSKLAMKEAGLEGLDEMLVGPTAIAFVGADGDPVAAAKELSKFAKDNPALVLKGGMMDGNVLGVDEVKKLASLESREVLLAKSAGVLKALMYRTAALLVAPASKTVRTVDALREKQEKAA